MIRDRIKELRRVKASELSPSPRNWRTHPQSQQEALKGILAEVGYADALLARELPDGSLELIDGHLRAEITPDQEVPVLVLDLDQDEAAKLLTVLDPLAGLAETNTEALGQLLQEMQTDSAGLQAMLDGLAESVTIPTDDNWADAFEEKGDTTAVDNLKQITFVLEVHHHAALLDHLKQYDGNKNDALVAWLQTDS